MITNTPNSDTSPTGFSSSNAKQNPNMSIDVAVEQFIRSHHSCSPNTLRGYRSALDKLCQFMHYYGLNHLEDMDGDVLESFFNSLHTPFTGGKEKNYRDWMAEDDWAKTYTPEYLHDIYRPINTMIRYYQCRKLLPTLYYEHPKSVTRKNFQVLGNEEFNLALSAAHSPTQRLVLLLMADTGLRLNEVAKANWGDIDWDQRIIRVDNITKGRTVVISRILLDLLQEYRAGLFEMDARFDGPIFLSNQGERFTQSGLQTMFRRITHRASVNFSARDLRCYAIRNWRRAGWSMEDICNAAGVSFRVDPRYAGLLAMDAPLPRGLISSLDYLVQGGILTNVSLH